MKCPKCGTEVIDQGLRQELRLNRLLLLVTTVIIAFAIIAAALYAVSALRSRPELAGVLETAVVSNDDGSDGYFTMSCSGLIYNIGTVGCFANITVTLADSRGWTETVVGSEDIGWLPPGGTSFVVSIFDLPTTYDGQEADLEDIRITLTTTCYDPFV